MSKITLYKFEDEEIQEIISKIKVLAPKEITQAPDIDCKDSYGECNNLSDEEKEFFDIFHSYLTANDLPLEISLTRLSDGSLVCPGGRVRLTGRALKVQIILPVNDQIYWIKCSKEQIFSMAPVFADFVRQNIKFQNDKERRNRIFWEQLGKHCAEEIARKKSIK